MAEEIKSWTDIIQWGAIIGGAFAAFVVSLLGLRRSPNNNGNGKLISVREFEFRHQVVLDRLDNLDRRIDLLENRIRELEIRRTR